MNVAQVRQEGLRADGMPGVYHEELARRREQERLDEDLARRMQGMAMADHNYPGGVFELANGAGHFDGFRQRATNVLTANYGRTQGNAANVLLAEYDAGRPMRREPPVIEVPVLPPPPPPPPPEPHLRRYNSTATRRSINLPQRRASERLVARRTRSDYATEAEIHRPPAARQLAGLNRSTTTGRVNEWRRHVEDDPSVAMIS